MVDVLERVFYIKARYATKNKLEQCDWVIEPKELLQFNFLKMKAAGEAFEIGYRNAKKIMPKLKGALAGAGKEVKD